MTRIGTNATGCAAARNAINVSDSTSKCSVCSGSAAQVARWMSRKPHCESGRERPARRESWRLIQRFTCRRSQGMARALGIRFPTTSNAPVCPAHSRKAGMSSGACWPSPSSVKTHAKSCCRAWDRPVLSATPLPRFFACRTTCAPADCARAAVSSVEPSSTTSTRGNCWRAAATRAAMLAPSLKQGITTAHVVGPGTRPA